MNKVQVVLSGFSVRLFCFVQAKSLCRYDCMHFCCTRACVYRCDGDVICVGHDLNWCSWWYVVCLCLCLCLFSYIRIGMSAVYMLNSVGERTPP